jgi:hypothetical protein
MTVPVLGIEQFILTKFFFFFAKEICHFICFSVFHRSLKNTSVATAAQDGSKRRG